MGSDSLNKIKRNKHGKALSAGLAVVALIGVMFVLSGCQHSSLPEGIDPVGQRARTLSRALRGVSADESSRSKDASPRSEGQEEHSHPTTLEEYKRMREEAIARDQDHTTRKRWDVNDRHQGYTTGNKPKESKLFKIHNPPNPFMHNPKEYLSRDFLDTLFMEEEMINRHMAPPDAYHDANHYYVETVQHAPDKPAKQ